MSPHHNCRDSHLVIGEVRWPCIRQVLPRNFGFPARGGTRAWGWANCEQPVPRPRTANSEKPNYRTKIDHAPSTSQDCIRDFGFSSRPRRVAGLRTETGDPESVGGLSPDRQFTYAAKPPQLGDQGRGQSFPVDRGTARPESARPPR